MYPLTNEVPEEVMTVSLTAPPWISALGQGDRKERTLYGSGRSRKGWAWDGSAERGGGDNDNKEQDNKRGGNGKM